MCYIPSMLLLLLLQLPQVLKTENRNNFLSLFHTFDSHFMSVSRLIFSKFLVFIMNLWCIFVDCSAYFSTLYIQMPTQFKDSNLKIGITHIERKINNIPLHNVCTVLCLMTLWLSIYHFPFYLATIESFSQLLVFVYMRTCKWNLIFKLTWKLPKTTF